MLDTARLARREPALPVGGDGPVRVLPAATRLSLRVKNIPVPHAEVQGAARLRGAPRDEEVGGNQASPGLRLALPINRCAVAGDRTIARLGPDEWLTLGLEADAEAMAAEIAAGLAGRFHALVDVSHRNVAFMVSGPDAVDILNAGCPLDLHHAAFPPGSATRTLLGKAEIVLMQPGHATEFRVECGRSFGAYVHRFLTEAALDSETLD